MHTPSDDIRLFASRLCWLVVTLVLTACSSVQTRSDSPTRSGSTVQSSRSPNLPPAGSGRGGYYQDDGPGDKTPDNLLATPDAEPRIEPYSRSGNKPYVVFGKSYVPMLDERPFKQRGIGSWYGKKFHGQKTSSGEIYDMYKMTAAHPTLPIPSYARVTNLANGNQVIVRVNDRGPFHSSRIIDLSYTAALKLGYVSRGSSQLEVERLLPDEIARMQSARQNNLATTSAPVAPVLESTSVQTASVPIVSVAARDIQPQPAVSQEEPSNAKPAVVPAAYAVPAASMKSAPEAGFYLQLGAYAQAANAAAARERLLRDGAATPVEVVAGNGLYRLYGGPYASRDEAMAAAQKIQEGGGAKPMVVQK
ncbi:MAG: septal ring lytic transglycosylase RlpA family protein [Proteobacteria bacterium]|nr:septal ring lytic transglycosylase RlpA family protein [Pseudomonadota bacterium]